MKLLLVNDDGIESEGILALARRLSPQHEIVVVAPMYNQSAKGHSSTFGDLSFENRGTDGTVRYYAVNGTPSDCTRFALCYLKYAPDLVISGINDGVNIGYDVWFSGTVGAAIEANFFHIPAIALSVYHLKYSDSRPVIFSYALDYIESHLDRLYHMIQGTNTTLNINVPMNDFIGQKICPLADSKYDAWYDEGKPLNVHMWQDFNENNHVGADIYYAQQGYVTLTPLKVNVSNMELIQLWNKQK